MSKHFEGSSFLELTGPSCIASLPDLDGDEKRFGPPHAAVEGHHRQDVAVRDAVVQHDRVANHA